MVRHQSAVKAARQALRRRERNVSAQSKLRTTVKSMRKALSQKFKNKEEASKSLTTLLNDTQKVLMKAASHGIIKSGTASRYISRLSAQVHKAANA